jgi:hypothetical protein
VASLANNRAQFSFDSFKRTGHGRFRFNIGDAPLNLGLPLLLDLLLA